MTDHPDYGIDAPGVRRAMLFAGVGGAVCGAIAVTVAARTVGAVAISASVAAIIAILAGVYGFGMAGYMTYASRIGKLRTRDRLLDIVADRLPLMGTEQVLDIGCGRGLMMIGAAKRLTTGTATGIDLWRSEDQSGNIPDAARENARIEGVVDRVMIQTGDARALPFTDAAFDVVLSHWTVHNLEAGT